MKSFCKFDGGGGGDVAQLVEHRTVTPLVPFPGAAKDFSPRVDCRCRLSRVSVQPPSAIACFTSVCTLKIP